jgi:hypothetical protein
VAVRSCTVGAGVLDSPWQYDPAQQPFGGFGKECMMNNEAALLMNDE